MKIIFYIVLLSSLLACKEKEPSLMIPDINENFDVIVVMGQSNTHFGLSLDETKDASDDRIFQLGRFGNHNMKILEAKEPLEHHTQSIDRIGFALTFAKLYANKYLANNRYSLIIPCGYGGTGFHTNHWNKGDTLYEDAIERVNYVINNSPGSKIVSILWHQGERDVGSENYEENLDNFIENFRKDTNSDGLPFIVGGMVPYWVNQTNIRINHQNIIKNTTNRLPNIGYADPTLPFLIDKPDDTFDEIHYDANGQRTLGKRYFDEYVKLVD